MNFFSASLIAITGFFLGACTHAGDRWMMGSSGFRANNQMMLVREKPVSFGYDRLKSQQKTHPDLGVFVQQKGLPDFLAETSTEDRHYFILYYLKKREAYACRTRNGFSKEVEFTGPYPVTDREYKLLNGFKRQADVRVGRD